MPAGTGNGYGTIEQLQALRRLEQDFDEWPAMRLRLRALTGYELERCRVYARQKEAPDGYDNARYTQAKIAFGLVQPDLAAGDDLDAACAVVDRIPVGVQAALLPALDALTYRSPGQAYLDLKKEDGSAEVGADTEPSISSSANSSA